MRRILLALIALLFAVPALAGELSAPDALAQAQAGKLVIVDVRTPGEWRQTGIAPGARTADFTAGPDAFLAEMLQLTGGDKAVPLGLICRSGNRSAKAMALLERNGFTNVVNIGEGMNGWVSRGMPTTAPN